MGDSFKSHKDKKARDCMTSPAVGVAPDETTRAAAEIMLKLRVSGLPVVDASNKPLGVVSESDFHFSGAATRQNRRETWLKILSGGQDMAAAYLDALEEASETVRQIMANPAICVDEETSVVEVAELMSKHRVKRLPVLREETVVGIITRSDLLRFFAPKAVPASRPVTLEEMEEALAEAGFKRLSSRLKEAASEAAEAGILTAEALKELVAEFERNKTAMHKNVGRQAKEQREEQLKALLKARFSDAEMAHLMTLAREAARRGETSVPALIFPAELCDDGGRAINLPDPAWPSTLRGKAADFFARWNRELRPLGYALSARIVSFPDGFPGDAELALVWGR